MSSGSGPSRSGRRLSPPRFDHHERAMSDNDWPAYYAVTVDRPPWQTVREAIRGFELEDPAGASPRFAVDLGCGAGRDARELLRHGWRVLAVDREVAAIQSLLTATPAAHLRCLETRVSDLADVEIPPCDLVNASLSLSFLAPDAFARAWERILAALGPGARFAGMLFVAAK